MDAGGWAKRHPQEQVVLQSRLYLEGMQELGLRVAHVSSRDLALGPDVLDDFEKSLQVQFVSANILVRGRPWIRPYLLSSHTIGGQEVAIGITGVTMPNRNAEESWPDSLALEIQDPLQAATDMLRILEGQSDIQILLAYLPSHELDRLMQESPGYDIVITSSGERIDPPPPGVGPTLLAVGSQCKYFGWVAVEVDESSVVRITDAGVDALDESIPDEPKTANLVESFLLRLRDSGGESAAAASGDPRTGSP